jgi:hypothetical protein
MHTLKKEIFSFGKIAFLSENHRDAVGRHRIARIALQRRPEMIPRVLQLETQNNNNNNNNNNDLLL